MPKNWTGISSRETPSSTNKHFFDVALFGEEISTARLFSLFREIKPAVAPATRGNVSMFASA